MAISFTHDEYIKHKNTHRVLLVQEVLDIKIATLLDVNGFSYDYTGSTSEAEALLNQPKVASNQYKLLITGHLTNLRLKKQEVVSKTERISSQPLNIADYEGFQLIQRLKMDSELKSLEMIMYGWVISEQDERDIGTLGATVIHGGELYRLNDMLRERSKLFKG